MIVTILRVTVTKLSQQVIYTDVPNTTPRIENNCQVSILHHLFIHSDVFLDLNLKPRRSRSLKRVNELSYATYVTKIRLILFF